MNEKIAIFLHSSKGDLRFSCIPLELELLGKPLAKLCLEYDLGDRIKYGEDDLPLPNFLLVVTHFGLMASPLHDMATSHAAQVTSLSSH